MLFPSFEFLFLFLPIVLFIYFILLRWSRSLQNLFLTLASLCFYAWGEPSFVLIMISSVIVNWLSALFIDKYRVSKIIPRTILIIALIINIGILAIYKYLAFAVFNINALFASDFYIPQLVLPLGISFFTFQAISYIIDVYRGHGQAQKNPLNLALYIAFFPQLIAGPIVRYETIAEQINERKETLNDFSIGTVRFIIGFIKKILIANNLAVIADASFASTSDLSLAMAWLGAIAYTLQIYFDFSAYSDMAIGLGRMFGFKFLENFNYPYISKSVTEFWRRWHISLGTWFRDYVYIPLGGNRVSSKSHHLFNLLIVWGATGLWHGANWTFIIWGLLYFVLLVIEKWTNILRYLSWFSYLSTLFFIIIGWVIFRSENLISAWQYIQTMLGMNSVAMADDLFIFYLNHYLFFFLAALLFCFPVYPWLEIRYKDKIFYQLSFTLLLLTGFLISLSYLYKNAENPFIYSNF